VVGPTNFHERITDGVAAWQAASASSTQQATESTTARPGS
jgi:hypothetical protein